MQPILHTYPAIGHLEHYRRLSTGGFKKASPHWVEEAGGLGPAGAFALTDRNIPPIILKKIGKVKSLISQRWCTCWIRNALVVHHWGPSSCFLTHFSFLLFLFFFFSFLLSFYTLNILTVLYSLLTLTYTYIFHQLYSLFHQIYSLYCILICLDYSAWL